LHGEREQLAFGTPSVGSFSGDVLRLNSNNAGFGRRGCGRFSALIREEMSGNRNSYRDGQTAVGCMFYFDGATMCLDNLVSPKELLGRNMEIGRFADRS